MKNYKIEIYKFKLTGKYYTTVIIEVEAKDLFDALSILRRMKFRINDGFIWYLTGVGLEIEVPRILL